MTKFLDKTGLAYFWEKVKAWIPFLSRKTQSIPFGHVDSTSTSTAFTATVDGITELRDGVFMYLRNGVVNSASGFTININGLGAKPVYQNIADATRVDTGFLKAKTFLFAYNSTRVSGGCWDIYYGISSITTDNDYRAYQIRHGATNSILPISTTIGRYRLVFTSYDGTKYVPANSSTSTLETSAKTTTTEKIDPFGEILYYNVTTNFSSGTYINPSYLWNQYSGILLGYSFNPTGTALSLMIHKPVYLKCIPQSDGGVIIDDTTPYTQTLPSTEDGKIYIFLGIAHDTGRLELLYNHPVYYYKDGAIREWTNAAETDVSGKADKVVTATNGHLAGLDSTGNLTDAGVSLRDLGKMDGTNFISESDIIYGKKIVHVQQNQWEIVDSENSDLYVFDTIQLYADGYNYLYAVYSNMSNNTVWFGVGSKDNQDNYVLSTVLGQINPMTEQYPILQQTNRSYSQRYLFFQIDVDYDYYQYLDYTFGVKDTQSMFAAVYDISLRTGASLAGSVEGKADKVSGAVSGNFAGLDATGNLTDSGSKASDFATASQGVPSGGTTGQVLAKHSNTDNDLEWTDPSGGSSFAFEIVGNNLQVTYGDAQNPNFSITNNHLIVTL